MKLPALSVLFLAMLTGMASAQQKPAASSTGASGQSQPISPDELPSAPAPQNNAPPAQAQRPLPQAPPTRRVGGAPPATSAQPDADSRDQFTIKVQANLVVVPVTVKDKSTGRLVDGLTKKDFTVLENGVEQPLKLFTSDPFPLSAAVVLDVNLPQSTINKINETMPALAGAFSQYDEVAFYTFGNSVERRLDYQAATDNLGVTLKRTKPKGQASGAPVVGGPLGQPTPTVNGEPIDPSVPTVRTYEREVHVLNDAIFRAAVDLSKRPIDRRKIIFVISNGREYGSSSSYADVLKVLLSDNIMLYAIAVDDSAVPVYKTMEKIHLPGHGYGNLLPKYAAATGGDVFAELTKDAIESAYARLTQEARNQYTLGYTAKAAGPSNQYREIEVLVHRPDLIVRAKNGYYPLPISAP